MQCEIRALSERRENGRKRVSDTLPKPGRVNEVCKEWLVHEDGALAYQLQQKEVQEHYSGNRSRNAIVREDFPKALDEQKREEEEAMARYLEMTRLQEERDARLAKEFAQRITLEEEEKQRRRLHEDEAIANQIQEKELQRTKDGKVRHLTATAGSSQLGAAAAAVGDVNSVGLPLPAQLPPPLPPPSSSAHAHKSHHHQHLQQLTKQFRATNVDEPDEPDLTDLEFQEEMMRQMQEKKDEELAKMLQQQEEEMDSLGMLDKDRLLAIEAQDKELARLLQDRERAKARRARERAKQRALLKKQQQQQETERDVGGESAAAAAIAARPNNLDVIRINKPKMPEPDELERVVTGGGGSVNTLPSNIAMAIDPTYTPSALHHTPATTSSSTISSPSYSLPSPDFEEDDDSPVPPYMPIQGQRRTSSLEKKQKKNKKDSCKQQ